MKGINKEPSFPDRSDEGSQAFDAGGFYPFAVLGPDLYRNQPLPS
jgi:hypothetical protein